MVPLAILPHKAELGSMVEEKFHVIIPKQYNDKVMVLGGKQVKIILVMSTYSKSIVNGKMMLGRKGKREQ